MRMIQGDWELTPQRVAIHRPTRTAVIADLHMGYQEARRRSGEAVPLVDWEMTLGPLLRVFREHDVESLAVAGDLFERRYDAALWLGFQSILAQSEVTFLGLAPGN